MSIRGAITLLLLLAVSVFAAEPVATGPVVPGPVATGPVVPGPVATGPAATVVAGFHSEPALPRDVLTNEGIVALADAGYSPVFIKQRIRLTTRTHFDVTVEGLTYLHRNGVPEELVAFMLDPAAPSQTEPAVPAAPVLFAPTMKSKKITVRVPRVPEPTPVIYVYYGGVAAPTSASTPVNSVAATSVAPTKNRFWWR